MEYKFVDEERVEITCESRELINMAQQRLYVWATTTANGKAIGFYISRDRNWRDDFVIATVGDFCPSIERDSPDWQDFGQSDFDGTSLGPVSIVVPRFEEEHHYAD